VSTTKAATSIRLCISYLRPKLYQRLASPKPVKRVLRVSGAVTLFLIFDDHRWSSREEGKLIEGAVPSSERPHSPFRSKGLACHLVDLLAWLRSGATLNEVKVAASQAVGSLVQEFEYAKMCAQMTNDAWNLSGETFDEARGREGHSPCGPGETDRTNVRWVPIYVDDSWPHPAAPG